MSRAKPPRRKDRRVHVEKTGIAGVDMVKFLYFSAPIFLSQVFLCVLAALREFILTPTGHLLY
jgi:hypothetical protein